MKHFQEVFQVASTSSKNLTRRLGGNFSYQRSTRGTTIASIEAKNDSYFLRK